MSKGVIFQVVSERMAFCYITLYKPNRQWLSPSAGGYASKSHSPGHHLENQ